MFVVFDLDGTLADDSHRVHFIKRERPDWQSYFRLAGLDKPVKPVIAVFQALARQGHTVEIWTGRTAAIQDATVKWLLEHVLEGHTVDRDGIAIETAGIKTSIRMRPVKDYRPQLKLKGEWLAEVIREGRFPDLAFDDRNAAVAWWRGQGIQCLHVKDNDY